MRACTRAGTRGRVPSCNALSNPPGAPAELCRTILKRSCIAADPLPGRRGAAGIVDRRRWAAGGHHHRPASNLKPSSSLRALRE
eukprot:8723980-Pyramimonas_sp.AAC.1